VGEQVGVVAAVGGEDRGEGGEDGGRLADVAEGAATAGLEGAQAAGHPLVEDVPGAWGGAVGEEGQGVVDLFLPARVGASVGEVDVPEDRRRRHALVQLVKEFFHGSASAYQRPFIRSA
jgi:hypothetical protein